MAKNKKSITDRIKSYEDACEALGYSPLTIESFSFLPEPDRKAAFAHHQLTVIAEALNEGWKPDFADSDEFKYYPWFRFVAGSGFRFVDCGCGRSTSRLGARLCFRSSELAEYAGKQFEAIYNDFMRQTSKY